MLSNPAARAYKFSNRHNFMLEERQDVTQAVPVYQKAMNSMAAFYREIYYIDLVRDNYCMIFPERYPEPETHSYKAAITGHFTKRMIDAGNEKEIQEFLSPENIREELTKKNCMELRYRRRINDGEYEWCIAGITAADRKDGIPVTVTMTIRSIEDIIRHEQSKQELLSREVQRAQTANRAKSEFLSKMSHDIRTPMNSILGMTTVASIHIGEQQRVREALDVVNVSGKYLLGLINEILDMSKIESGKMKLSATEFNLMDVVENLNTLFRTKMEQKHLRYEVNAAGLKHTDVIGDAQRLQQIFVNILGNAIKYTPEGGKITLTLSEKETENAGSLCYNFIFEDTGIGMDQKVIDVIFEPFVRSNEPDLERIEGTGLGLPIAVSIARLMNGDIQVESTPGKGSKFSVRVYLTPDNAKRDRRKNVHKENAFECYRKLDYSGKRVLLAEDNVYNVEVAKEFLNLAGIEVDTVTNGKEAVEKVSSVPEGYYDLIFMDIQMPVMNGCEAATVIREMEREDMKNIPIIAMTADVFAEDIRKTNTAKMNGHLSKPIELSALEKVLRQWL